MILIDVRPWELTEKEDERLLEKSGITVNKNTIPYDPASPFITSGIRIGAAVTTQGSEPTPDCLMFPIWIRSF